ncbi:general secretion pathway protein GspK [Dissulfurirhabdus thermomarina]|uniref:General secretion pathway protein GspK n=1 Tax=Dissulfurirhabdus thermomarina TaxID=1765737 RepID=A0A6N9TQJ3_DISTH|nr:type II secretion system protein GspK [Dissulfurirhabdus thermomarina]NDY43542.1 general secretion pathway protein GspK [Dissulfurirhabdus thermomarina]NMX22502.1 general secretion pathway protein GspK [Dissulfurirhabdus thermomarina]
MRRDGGTALILVLWVLALLTTLGGLFALETRIRRNLGQAAWDGLRARAAAHSILNLVLAARRAGGEAAMPADGLPRAVVLGGREVTFTLEDERGKVDLNQAPEALIRAVVEGLFGMEGRERAAAVADGILDWRDADDLPRLDGAEAPNYEARVPPIRPADGPFHLVEELLLVHGVTRTAFEGTSLAGRAGEAPPAIGLRRVFTVYNGTDRVDTRFAPAPLRELVPGTMAGEITGAGVLRLQVAWGGRRVEIYFRPRAGGGAETLQWTEGGWPGGG